MWILWSIWSDCHEKKANLENKKVGQGAQSEQKTNLETESPKRKEAI